MRSRSPPPRAPADAPAAAPRSRPDPRKSLRKSGVIRDPKTEHGKSGRCHSERGARSVLPSRTLACAPTEESLRWAHGPVGYVGLGAKDPPVPDKDSSVGAQALEREDGFARRLPQNDSDLPDAVFLRIRYECVEIVRKQGTHWPARSRRAGCTEAARTAGDRAGQPPDIPCRAGKRVVMRRWTPGGARASAPSPPGPPGRARRPSLPGQSLRARPAPPPWVRRRSPAAAPPPRTPAAPARP